MIQTEDELHANYEKYRGKCKPLAEAEIEKDSTLRLVRGYYYCPYWGKQQHWWTETPDGTINDPSKLQFPSAGHGEYVEFDGNIICEVCCKKQKEEYAYFMGSHAYCSSECYIKDVM
jgi:hypothetical protein